VIKRVIIELVARLCPEFHSLIWPKCFILYGHLISDKSDCMAAQRYRYPKYAEFDEFKTLAQKIGYRFVGIKDFMSGKYEKMILLTFDDGFIEVLDFYLKTRLNFVLFIIGDALCVSNFSFGGFKYVEKSFLNRDQLEFLKSGGVHIGFHTKTHKRITSSQEVFDEIKPSAEINELMSKPLCFAYPFSAPNDFECVDNEIYRNGYKYIFDTKSQFGAVGNHLFRVPMDLDLFTSVRNPIIYNILKARFRMIKRWVFFKSDRSTL
jgi:hypothetical protein